MIAVRRMAVLGAIGVVGSMASTVAFASSSQAATIPRTAFTRSARVTISGREHSAFPASTRISGGRLLSAWRVGSTHTSNDGDIWTSTSSDNGATWSTPVAKLTSTTLDLRDPGLTYSGGTTYLSYFVADASDNAKGVYVARSTNGGATFGAAVRVDGGMPYAGSSAAVLALPKGRLLMTFYGHDSGEGHDSAWASLSTNGGASWGAPVRILDGTADGRDYQEPVPTLTSDGTVRVYTRWGTDSEIGSIDSADGGRTWTNARELFAGTGRPACSATTSGQVACIYRSAASGQALIRFSGDDGRTFSDASVFDATTSLMTYAALVPLSGTSWAVTYSMQASSSSAVVMATTLSERTTAARGAVLPAGPARGDGAPTRTASAVRP